MEGGKKKGESFAKAKADKEKADKEAKEAAEKASAEPVVLEEDDEFEEFEQEGARPAGSARPAAARPRSPRCCPRFRLPVAPSLRDVLSCSPVQTTQGASPWAQIGQRPRRMRTTRSSGRTTGTTTT